MKTRIYIVDDHELLRRGLTALLNAEPDMEVCGEAGDAASALQGIIKLQPALVTVDISLPGNSGLELIKNIHAYDPKIEIVALTVHQESLYGLRALRAGAHAYLTKQDVVDHVAQTIRRVLRGQLCVSEKLAHDLLSRVLVGQTPDDPSPIAGLTDRELEIAALIGSGLVSREIAAKLHISVKTVESHRARIKEKLSLPNATRLIQFCVHWVEENKNTRSAEVAVEAGL